MGEDLGWSGGDEEGRGEPVLDGIAAVAALEG